MMTMFASRSAERACNCTS